MSMSQFEPEDTIFNRPSASRIKEAWRSLCADPLLSLSSLKSRALSRDGIGPLESDGSVLLRSVHWRFFHSLLPTPTSQDLFAPSLEVSRAAYTSLRRRYLVAPDGRWASDCSHLVDDGPSAGPSSPSVTPSFNSPQGAWDPLSLDGSSPWKTWFEHLELRGTIRQDVERTFPDQPYFTLERVRQGLTTALFLYAVTNPDVGYRQGMHELLAVFYLVTDLDSLDPSESGVDEAMRATLDRRYVEHDAFALFQSLMRNAKAFYEWRQEEGPRVKSRSANAPQAPIITRCNHIQGSLLRRIDPQLRENLEKEGVEGQLYLIRWLRLLFTRELPFHIALRIWDGVFAEDPGLGILDFISVAMLLLIRNELLSGDHPMLLTSLLRYPAPSVAYPFQPHLILAQAIFLRSNVSPTSGVEVVLQNQDVLGIKVKPPDTDAAPKPPRQPPRPLPSGIAQGLYQRAQAAGWDQAFLSAVGDLRKNLPDTSTAYSYLPNLPFSPLHPQQQRDPYSTIPSTSALPARVPFQPPAPVARVASSASMDSSVSIKSLRDAERDLAELRLAMLGMGKSMAGWLEQLDSASHDGDAWRGMERVRDSLLDAAGTEVEDIVREWGWNESLEAPPSASSTPGSLPQTLPSDAPVDAVASPRQDMEKTPTQPQFPIMASPTTLPAPTPNQGSSKRRLEPPVPLSLSRREDTPSASLPRSPMSTGAMPYVSETRKTFVELPPSNMPALEVADVEQPKDPLAGIGASKVNGYVSPREVGRRGAPSGVRSGDPLGVRG